MLSSPSPWGLRALRRAHLRFFANPGSAGILPAFSLLEHAAKMAALPWIVKARKISDAHPRARGLTFHSPKLSTSATLARKAKRMSELQLIETALKRAARRRRWECTWRGLWQGLLAGGLIWLLVQGFYKLFPLPTWVLTAAAATAGALLLICVTVASWRKSSLLQTARWVDGKQRLQE